MKGHIVASRRDRETTHRLTSTLDPEKPACNVTGPLNDLYYISIRNSLDKEHACGRRTISRSTAERFTRQKRDHDRRHRGAACFKCVSVPSNRSRQDRHDETARAD